MKLLHILHSSSKYCAEDESDSLQLDVDKSIISKTKKLRKLLDKKIW